MVSPVSERNGVKSLSADPAADPVARRKNRVLAILAEGLPVLPSHIMQLNGLLASSPVDLKRISRIIRTDASLTAQLIRLCNSALFGIRRRIFKVEEAAVLMGADRLRTMVFTCYVMECSGHSFQEQDVQTHWRHGFLTAILSEKIARAIAYPEPDQAYLGGLLHDVGKLPLLMVASEEDSGDAREILAASGDGLATEREYFGLDHCEVGRWIGISWNFYPCHIDVFESHHRPKEAKHDPLLVGIVGVADRFCELRESEPVELPLDGETTPKDPMLDYIQTCLPTLGSASRERVLRLLESNYQNSLPMLDQSYGASARAASASRSEPLRESRA